MAELRNYELTVLYRPDLTSEELKKSQDAVASTVKSLGGDIKKIDEWGRRPMAYKIKKQQEAVYLLYHLSLDPEKSQVLEQNVIRTSGVLRHLFVIADVPKKKEE
ncbi:TPA: 30S ribosomal protein S6 [Candidatus Woesearchaeota archaeon]|nr:30S ribosomal protein S6 [Candidatus Woesearchaeota archaeon]